MTSLEDLRARIDNLDNDLIELLDQRMQVIKEVGELKRHQQSGIYRPEREKVIVDRLYERSKGLLSKAAIEAIFLEIFAVSRTLELPEKVAYLGPEGSFTHQAAENRFGATGSYFPLKTIKGVFDAIDSGRAVFGVIPIENNQAGAVTETIELLSERDVKIVAEMIEPVHFSLASVEDEVTQIHTIYSKDIAFRQCQNFLNEHFDGDTNFIQVDSTSDAARRAKKSKGTASLCSLVAAKTFDIPILFYNVEDTADNRTRFLIISKEFRNQKSGHDKTSVLAKIKDEPGSLVDLLQAFEKRNINLTKIDSRPAKLGAQFKYWFLIDFEGHHEDEAAQEIFAEFGDQMKLLGSYLKVV
ncbi:MAG: prephenate dehydratase [Saprospiraceae bacterium]|nr:prephenate dehydratase [Saprospiraceae bacterium]